MSKNEVKNEELEVQTEVENIETQQDEAKLTETETTSNKQEKKEKNSASKNSNKQKKNKQQKVRSNKAKEMVSELKKVTWPSFPEVVKKTGVVLMVVAFFFVVLFGIDWLLSLLYGLLTKAM